MINKSYVILWGVMSYIQWPSLLRGSNSMLVFS